MTTDVWTSELRAWLDERSRALGFELSGLAAVDGVKDSAEAQDAVRFESWIDAGRAGEMEYLKRRDENGILLRASVKDAYPWVNSVVVCAASYRSAGPLSIADSPPTSGWIARYAWSGQKTDTLVPTEPEPRLRPDDYHKFLLANLQQLADAIEAQTAATSKCFVDTGPLVERSVAARAGVGWIGKNTCLLNEKQGSWLLLGVILTSLRVPLEVASLSSPDRCGTCTRCIDACPTDALVAPHQMDASRCIAYLTIEKKGLIPLEFRPAMGRQVFGCDICQDVCPWNRPISTRSIPSEISVRQELINPDLEWLAAMDAPTFKQWFKGSPLERTRRSRIHRNVAIAMGNSGEERFVFRLQAWSTGDDPVLAEASVWALERIRTLKSVASSEPQTDSSDASCLC